MVSFRSASTPTAFFGAKQCFTGENFMEAAVAGGKSHGVTCRTSARQPLHLRRLLIKQSECCCYWVDSVERLYCRDWVSNNQKIRTVAIDTFWQTAIRTIIKFWAKKSTGNRCFFVWTEWAVRRLAVCGDGCRRNQLKPHQREPESQAQALWCHRKCCSSHHQMRRRCFLRLTAT